jgi:hypothetical protein
VIGMSSVFSPSLRLVSSVLLSSRLESSNVVISYQPRASP